MSDVTSALKKIQLEGTRFRSPVSESLIQTMAGSINALIDQLLPVGTVVDSMLSETDFQDQLGTDNWVLADGRDVTGSVYEDVTGDTVIPDLRGIFTRGKNNGRSTATGDSGGEKALGAYTADVYEHIHLVIDFVSSSEEDHVYNASGTNQDLPDHGYGTRTTAAHFTITGTDTGLQNGILADMYTSRATSVNNEVFVRSVTVNKFIRIN